MNLVGSFFNILTFYEILRTPTRGFLVLEMLVYVGFVLIAFLFGIMVGWAWKPIWVSFGNCTFDNGLQVKNQMVESTHDHDHDQQLVQVETNLDFGSKKLDNSSCSSSAVNKDEGYIKDEDLRHLWHLVEKRDGGPPWKHMMDGSTSTMAYQAWQRAPERGPPQYCSVTVYEDATPELLRDFFWDDDLRLKWDDMLLHATILEEFPEIGASVVHWIRRFPLFCSDREYTIARRIWELDGSFYCVTKGVPCPTVPRKQKPRRVDVYYSSWFIQPVKSKKGNDTRPACEVTFFHHEDMGIPWEIAKLGVRQAMWGTAKKIEQGFRWYQKERASLKTISHHIEMARMSTKIDQNYLNHLESDDNEDMAKNEVADQQEKQTGLTIPKLLVIGGAVILACTLNRGLLTTTVVFKVAKKFGNLGKRAFPTTQL
uniref:uncharacterized protein LOC122587038 n=1 Tax=Erigeron canadensis TaxID=72917 RepID=UPI001CB8D754|nr:uncharacterized protein LOC122587038 [Erigeron canadensis]